ncbi:hypothetical protein, partial [Silvanigrella sp.]|uniref:hypothetical protein n=1 Tax=Silvanigrella sp. TaxID=2024976 RepID=UPI0037C79284
MSSFCKISLVLSSVTLAVVGCNKSTGGSNSSSGSNDAQAAASQGTTPAATTPAATTPAATTPAATTPAATTQDYLLIGAPNGSVAKKDHMRVKYLPWIVIGGSRDGFQVETYR